MRTHPIPTLIVAVAVIIIITATIFTVVPGFIRWQELQECESNPSTATCGNW